MTNLNKRICGLDDVFAEQLLFDLAQRTRNPANEAWSPELAQALAQAFHIPETGEKTASKADLARAVLQTLAEDPAHERTVDTMIHSPMPECFGLLSTAAAITTAVMILKTHVLIERDKEGKLFVKIETASISHDVIKTLVENLLGMASLA